MARFEYMPASCSSGAAKPIAAPTPDRAKDPSIHTGTAAHTAARENPNIEEPARTTITVPGRANTENESNTAPTTAARDTGKVA
jgi:hypothetical protein